MKVSELKPLEKNPFKLKGDEELELIGQSIESFKKMMTIRKIVIDENNEILGGNKRFWALKKLGYKIIPDEWIDKRTDLSEAEKKEFIVKDNAHWGSSWDYDMLSDWEVPLRDWGVPENPFNEVERLEAEEDDFEVPEDCIETDIVLGDLFEIGEHRLLCGDSTDSDQVAKLMNGEKADMVFTDPPYGNGNSGKYGRGQLGVRTIANDEDFSVVRSFINLNVSNAYLFFLQWRTFKDAIQTLEENNITLKTVAVWDKKNAGLNGAGGMAEQWEAILIAGNVKFSKFGGNVFSISREQKKRVDSPHPHQKPIPLLSELLKYFLGYDLLLDPFLGSGSTMVAAHQLKRKCYGMELDVKYCDVIIQRMLKLDKTLKIKRNGIDETKKWLEKLG